MDVKPGSPQAPTQEASPSIPFLSSSSLLGLTLCLVRTHTLCTSYSRTPNASTLTPLTYSHPAVLLLSPVSLFIGQIIIDFILRQAPVRLYKLGRSIPTLYLPAHRACLFYKLTTRRNQIPRVLANMSSSEDDTPLVKMNGRSSGKSRVALVIVDAQFLSHPSAL